MKPNVLKVVSYNVRYFGHGTRGLFSTKGGMDRIAKGLSGLTPLADIVCLQEVESSSLRSHFFHVEEGSLEAPQAQRFATKLHAELGGRATYDTYYFPAHAYRLTEKTSVYTTGLVILVRDGLKVVMHNADGPADVTERAKSTARFKQTRIVAHVRVKTRTGQTVDVFNTHLSLPRAFAKNFWTQPKRMGFGKNQLAEAARVSQFIAAERGSDAYVLVGDFNSLPGSPTYRYFVEECGLCDAYKTHRKLDATALIEHPTAGFLNLRMRIDHVLSGPGLKWVDFDDTFHFDEGGKFSGMSDHVPMIGSFTFA